jgi:hypothetical protein
VYESVFKADTSVLKVKTLSQCLSKMQTLFSNSSTHAASEASGRVNGSAQGSSQAGLLTTIIATDEPMTDLATSVAANASPEQLEQATPGTALPFTDVSTGICADSLTR